jgi:hypothetical protein
MGRAFALKPGHRKDGHLPFASLKSLSASTMVRLPGRTYQVQYLTDHSGLVSVVEGAGRQIAESRGIKTQSIRGVFTALASDCKLEAGAKQIGAVDEIVSMMDSFSEFTNKTLFIDSRHYQLSDGTNRHGIAHGSYTDADYGNPINFYKIISGIDFLTLVVSFSQYLMDAP